MHVQTRTPAEGSSGAVPSPIISPVRGRRRPWLLALGVALSAVGVLTVIWLVGLAGQRQEVLAVRSEVPFGSTVTADHLTVARISVDPGLLILPASAATTVVGQVATTNLLPGMLLTEGAVEPAGEPRPGRVLVPVAVPFDRMPAGGLQPGDRVLVLDADAADETLVAAMVVRVGPADVDGTTVLDVTAARADGPRLARASAVGRLALVVEPRG